MRKVKMAVGNTQIGTALTWAYPHGMSYGNYRIPTYELKVTGTDSSGRPAERKFETFRFGVQGKAGALPRVVGLADFQTHTINSWLPHYSVHSARSREKGAWQVYGNFLIHDGPDDPLREVYASIGCLEICNGPRGFDVFNDYLIGLSGPSSSSRADQLAEIGRSRSMEITYLKATRPPLTK